MPRSLNIRNLPDDVLTKVRDRMQRDQWYSLQDLVTELLRDYADGRITPAAPPPPFDTSRRPGKSNDGD